MPRYLYVGEEPTIFADLTHSDAVMVRRDGEWLRDDDGNELDHTVVLEPGDELVVPEPIEHALLSDLEEQPAQDGLVHTAQAAVGASVANKVTRSKPKAS